MNVATVVSCKLLQNIYLASVCYLECSCRTKQQTHVTSGYITMWGDVELRVVVLLTRMLSRLRYGVTCRQIIATTKKTETLKKMC